MTPAGARPSEWLQDARQFAPLQGWCVSPTRRNDHCLGRRWAPNGGVKDPARRGARVSKVRFGDETWAVISLPLGATALPCCLSAAEREVARLALEGRSNAEIASRRGTSACTVANQLAAIFRKLGISSRTELACACLTDAYGR